LIFCLTVLSEPIIDELIRCFAMSNSLDEEAEYLASSMAQVMVSITRGKMQPVQPPTDKLDLEQVAFYL
jgi:hypothetical protein